MASKFFKILATTIALSAVVYLGTELTVARPRGGGHFGGGHVSRSYSGGGVRHLGGAHVRSFGGAHFRASRRSFSGSHIRRFGGAHFRASPRSFSGSHIRRFSGAHFRASPRSFSGSHIRRFGGAHFRTSRRSFAHIRGAYTLRGRAAWNRWSNHYWATSWHRGWGGWGGPVYWPYFYGDFLAFVLWPYGYYDPFWAYGNIFVWDTIFWPGPYYAYSPSYFDVYGGYGDYAYGGPARTRTAKARNLDREITGSTANNNELAQTCGGLAPGVTDLPFEYIEKRLKPTDEQRKALVALKTASTQASDILKTSCSSAVMLTPLGRLDAAEKRIDGMTKALGIVRAPLDNFYSSLTEKQKNRFAALGRTSHTRRNRGARASGNDLAGLCSRHAESFTQLPVERVEQSVKPTQRQQGAFDKLKAASKEAANKLQASCPTRLPQSPMDRFDALGKRLDAMAEAIKTVRPALATFYNALTDEQKARFNILGPPSPAG